MGNQGRETLSNFQESETLGGKVGFELRKSVVRARALWSWTVVHNNKKSGLDWQAASQPDKEDSSGAPPCDDKNMVSSQKLRALPT